MRLFYIILTALFAQPGFAQLPVDFRTEQVHLELDKTSWNPGDTVALSGVITCLAANRRLPYSNYLYVELLDKNDSVLTRQKVDCKNGGTFRAEIPTERTNSGIYVLRSYTQLMRNFSPDSFGFQFIYIGKQGSSSDTSTEKDFLCRFYPTSGVLCPDKIQDVTVCLSDQKGNPLKSLPVALLSENGDTLTLGKTSSSGFAMLHFIPQKDKKYFISANTSDKPSKYALPLADDKSMKVQCSVNDNRLFYELLNVGKKLADVQLYLYSKENGICKVKKTGESGIVLLSNHPKIVTLFLTDGENRILSETSVLCKHGYKMPQSLDSLMRDRHLLALKDTVIVSGNSRISLRLVPENDKWVSHAESDLLYLSDYSSDFPFPQNVFGERGPERFADLQAWLKTARFNRFLLSDALQKDTAVYSLLPEENMIISGTVNTTNDLVLRGGTVVAYNTSNTLVYDAPIDKKGRFRMAVDDFKEGDTFFLQVVNVREKPVDTVIRFDDMTFPPGHSQKNFALRTALSETDSVSERSGFRNQHLPEVVVKAKFRKPETISTNKFYGFNYVDRQKIEEHNYLSLLDILRNMPGIVVRHDKTGEEDQRWHLMSTRGNSTLGRKSKNGFCGNSELILLVDGIQQDYRTNELTLNMPASEIEEVRLLRPWESIAYVFGGLEGAISVKTRFRENKKPAVSKGVYYTPMGLTRAVGKRNGAKSQGKERYRVVVDVIEGNDVWSVEYDNHALCDLYRCKRHD